MTGCEDASWRALFKIKDAVRPCQDAVLGKKSAERPIYLVHLSIETPHVCHQELRHCLQHCFAAAAAAAAVAAAQFLLLQRC